MKMWSLLLLLLMEPVSLVSARQPSVSVGASTMYGESVQVGETTVNQFLGVRFGQSPVGSLRFSKPVAATLPAEVNATTHPSPCPGLMSVLPMDEDCLFLSLYVPQSRQQDNGGDQGKSGLPVMVWLHGGGFVFGSASDYDGNLLAAEGNVIVVITNYRLGPLGFLSTGDNSSVGNYGLWDQWLALTWVRDNIRHFGGNENDVTIFGESAGGASVSYHMTSPHSQGLFQRAILQSGCRLCSWATTHDPISKAQRLGRQAKCSDVDSTRALVSCLRGQPWKTLKPMTLASSTWAPVVDGDFVLPFNTSTTFDGPFIVGTNNREGGLLLKLHKITTLGANNRASHLKFVERTLYTLYPALMTAASEPEKTLAAKVLDCVYRKEGSSESHVTDAELEAFVGDISIELCSQQFVNEALATGDRYLYYFDYYPDSAAEGKKGMDHAMDIDFTFGFGRGLRGTNSPFYNRSISKRDRLVAERFRALLTNFARSGNPNQPAALPGWPVWPPYVKGNQSYLSISSTPQVASHRKGDVFRVWLDTIPAILRSQGAVGLKDTPWAQCPEKRGVNHSPTLSASFCLAVGTILWVAFAMVP